MSTALSDQWIGPSLRKAQWDLAASEDGVAFECGQFGDKTVTVSGTFGAATVTIQGSNDGTNWFTCTDFLGVAATFTVGGIKTLGNSPRYIRPTSGVGQSVTVIIIARGAAR